MLYIVSSPTAKQYDTNLIMGLVSPLKNERSCFNQQATSLRKKICGNSILGKFLILWTKSMNRPCHCHWHWQSARDNNQAGTSWSLKMSCHMFSAESKCSWERNKCCTQQTFQLGIFGKAVAFVPLLCLKYCSPKIHVSPMKITQGTFTVLIRFIVIFKLLLRKAVLKREQNGMSSHWY